MNGLLNYFMPGEVGGMPTSAGTGFNNPYLLAGLTMLAANRGPNQAQAIPLGLQALQGQQRFNLMQQQAEEEKKQRDEERRLRALERARLEEARAAQERVLPEMLGLPSTYRGTTTQTMPGMEYATPTGDVSSPYTAEFQTQRMPDTQVQVPTFNQEQYMQDLARSGLGMEMLKQRLGQKPSYEKLSPGEQLIEAATGRVVAEAPNKPATSSTLAKLQAEYDAFPIDDPRRLTWKKAIDKEVEKSPGLQVSFGTPVAAVDAQGNPVFIQPSKEGGAPSVIPGYAPPPQKMGEATQKQVTGIDNLRQAIQDYKNELKVWQPQDAIDPAKRAKMSTTYNNMMLQAKEAYGLGVLNGPDYKILTDTIADPTSMKGITYGAYGSLTGTDPLKSQADALDSLMGSMKQTIEQSQPGARRKEQQPQAKGLPIGRVVNGYRYKGGNPKDKNNWEKI